MSRMKEDVEKVCHLLAAIDFQLAPSDAVVVDQREQQAIESLCIQVSTGAARDMEKEELRQPRKVRLTPATRPMAVQAIYSAPDGYYFEPLKEPTRSLDQNAKLHAMCGDIAKQMPWMGRKLGTDDWKRPW